MTETSAEQLFAQVKQLFGPAGCAMSRSDWRERVVDFTDSSTAYHLRIDAHSCVIVGCITATTEPVRRKVIQGQFVRSEMSQIRPQSNQCERAPARLRWRVQVRTLCPGRRSRPQRSGHNLNCRGAEHLSLRGAAPSILMNGGELMHEG